MLPGQRRQRGSHGSTTHCGSHKNASRWLCILAWLQRSYHPALRSSNTTTTWQCLNRRYGTRAALLEGDEGVDQDALADEGVVEAGGAKFNEHTIATFPSDWLSCLPG